MPPRSYSAFLLSTLRYKTRKTEKRSQPSLIYSTKGWALLSIAAHLWGLGLVARSESVEVAGPTGAASPTLAAT
jgi:hypothetical protein